MIDPVSKICKLGELILNICTISIDTLIYQTLFEPATFVVFEKVLLCGQDSLMSLLEAYGKTVLGLESDVVVRERAVDGRSIYKGSANLCHHLQRLVAGLCRMELFRYRLLW